MKKKLKKITTIEDLATLMQNEFLVVHGKFDSVDARFDCIDARFDRVDERFDSLKEEVKEIRNDLENLKLRMVEVKWCIVSRFVNWKKGFTNSNCASPNRHYPLVF